MIKSGFHSMNINEKYELVRSYEKLSKWNIKGGD